MSAFDDLYPVIIEAFVFVEIPFCHCLRVVRDRLQTDRILDQLVSIIRVDSSAAPHRWNRRRKHETTTTTTTKIHFVVGCSSVGVVVLDVRSTLKHIDFCYSYKLKMAHGMPGKMMITFKRIWLSGKYDNHKSLGFFDVHTLAERMRATLVRASAIQWATRQEQTLARSGRSNRSNDRCAHNWREPKRLTKIT